MSFFFRNLGGSGTNAVQYYNKSLKQYDIVAQNKLYTIVVDNKVGV